MAWEIDFGFHNLMTCSGWDVAPGFFDMGGPCMMGRLGLVILFFITALVRKWGGEEINVPFSFMWALILGLGSYLISIIFLGSFKIALIIGFAAMLFGGYALAYFMGEESGDGSSGGGSGGYD